MPVITKTENSRMELSEIVMRAEFQILTPRQQKFVRSYIESGVTTGTYDALSAVQSAYRATPQNAVLMSYELLGNRKIKKVLDLHWGRTELDSILTDLEHAIRKSLRKDSKTGGLSIATTKALEFYERHSGRSHTAASSTLVAENEIEVVPEDQARIELVHFSVGDICVLRDTGAKYRVTAVDENGKPTDGEPL